MWHLSAWNDPFGKVMVCGCSYRDARVETHVIRSADALLAFIVRQSTCGLCATREVFAQRNRAP